MQSYIFVTLNDSSPLCYLNVVLKKHRITQNIYKFSKLISFGFVFEPSSDLSLQQQPSSEILYLNLGMRSHSFTIYIIKFIEINV